jgi:hypothetical protein
MRQRITQLAHEKSVLVRQDLQSFKPLDHVDGCCAEQRVSVQQGGDWWLGRELAAECDCREEPVGVGGWRGWWVGANRPEGASDSIFIGLDGREIGAVESEERGLCIRDCGAGGNGGMVSVLTGMSFRRGIEPAGAGSAGVLFAAGKSQGSYSCSF